MRYPTFAFFCAVHNIAHDTFGCHVPLNNTHGNKTGSSVVNSLYLVSPRTLDPFPNVVKVTICDNVHSSLLTSTRGQPIGLFTIN